MEACRSYVRLELCREPDDNRLRWVDAEMKSKGSGKIQRPVGLKMIADYLGVHPGTVSVVLNNTPGRSIPEKTRERVRAAARKFNYQPSLLARSLKKQKSFAVGVLAPELGDGYHTMVMNGIGDHLMREGYSWLTAHHKHKADLIEEYPRLLMGRGAEGLILIDTAIRHRFPIPVVAIAGHRKIRGVTNVVLDHRRAAERVLQHLVQLGHTEIAFMRGQPFSSDSAPRWENLVAVAKQMRIRIDPALTIELKEDISSPELGYPVVQTLLRGGKRFTAVVAFNDMSAIGAIRALRDANLRVPEDVSVVGFDDIRLASFNIPRLTTIHQPLREMGEMAARILLERIQGRRIPEKHIVEPELVIRETTAAVKSR